MSRKRALHLLLALFSCFACCHGLTSHDIPIIPYEKNIAPESKGPIAIVSLFKDEADFLKEWIEYHLCIGVSHFYLYNNGSQDHYLEILTPYIEQGIVELFDVPFDSTVYAAVAKTHNFVQVTCYQHAIKRARRKNFWLAIIDSDEFICPVSSKNLLECLQEFAYAGTLYVFWQTYGTSDVWDLQPGELMIEKLLYKFPRDYGENRLFKSIVRPETARCRDPHWTSTRDKAQIFENHSRFTHTHNFAQLPVKKIRINHYSFRTENFYQNVKKKRRKAWGYASTPESEQKRKKLSNSVYDPIMLRFVPELKKRMFKKTASS